MIRRPRRVLPAILTALVVLAACVAVAVSLVQRLVGAHEFVSYARVADRLHGLHWQDMSVLLGGIAVLIVGLALLALALLPGRSAVLPLAEEPGLRAALTRTSLRAALHDAAAAVDGVESARIRLRHKVVKISARADHERCDGLAEQVCAAVNQRIQEIGPQPVRRVRAKVHRTRTGGV